MATIGSSAIATIQAKRFSARAQGNMHRRGGGPGVGGGRTSLYKQMYGNGARNGVKKNSSFIEKMMKFFISLGNQYQ
jgi:hypothetical protein